MEGNPRSPRIGRYGIAVGLVALGVLSLAIDRPVAQGRLAGGCPAALAKLFELAEVFGHGFGVVAILLAVWILSPPRRWMLVRLTTASLGAGVVANFCKLLVARVRPHHFDLDQSIATSFLDWAPLWSRPSYEQGCPSSHTATAVGLAVGLAWAFPRGRWMFYGLAALVACQRIESGAHFVSDTLWGAAVGWLVGHASIEARSMGWLGNKLEGRWAKEYPPATISLDANHVRSAA